MKKLKTLKPRFKARIRKNKQINTIETFTKVLANELGRYKIRVNSISPGPTNTRMMNENTPVQLAEKIKENIPMKRFAEVNDIANVALFLSSDLSTFITGQNLRVAGGM